MKIDHQLFCITRQPLNTVCNQGNKRQHQRTTQQFEQQAPQRHATACGILAAGVQHHQQAAAQVGTDHQAQRHL
ncbi:hypothetical protein D3C78_1623470 [compost metagenome]